MDEVCAEIACHDSRCDHSTDELTQLVFLNRCFWPDSEATGQLLTDLCEHLSGSFDVHVVCGQPNSPTQDFQGSGIQTLGRTTVHRLSHAQFAKRVPAGRLINLLSFSRAAAQYLRHCDLVPQIVISQTDPFLLPVVAHRYARRTGARFICYLQDIYPDVAEEIGKVRPGMVTRQIRARLRKAYREADRVIVLGECMRRRLQAPPWALPHDLIDVIPNWADCRSIRPLDAGHNPFRQQHGLQDRFVVMHSGNMGLTQRLDVLMESTRSPQWPSEAVLVFVGDGAVRRKLMARAQRWDDGRVRFLPYQPRERLAESLSAADLHVVSMHERITGCLCPSKLYGILAAGRAVLAIADRQTDLWQTVNASGLGLCCEPGDPHQIAELVGRAASDRNSRLDWGARARSLAERQFDRGVVTARMAELIHQLAIAPAAPCSTN